MKITITKNELILETTIKLSLQKKFSLLELSNQALEKDLEEFALKVRCIENAHHLWATSWLPLRLDDLEGLALYYYVTEILNYLQEKNYKEKLFLEGEFDSYFKGFLNHNYPKFFINRKYSIFYFKIKLGQILNPFRYVFKVIFRKKQAKQNLSEIWMSSPLDINKHRYKHLLNKLHFTKAFFAGRLQDTVRPNKKGSSLSFLDYLSFSDVVISLKKGFKLNKEKKRINPKTLLEYAVLASKPQHLVGTILKEKSVENAIKTNKPNKIFFTTANTYPTARIIARQAYINNIPFIIVACRPMFTRARLEERLARPDILKINKAHVADYYTVWDQYSKKTLIDQGFNENKIFVTNPNKPNYLTKKHSKIFEDALLLLFTHESILNQRLIEELYKLKNWKYIIIRQHPLMSLTEKQTNLLYQKFNILADITSKDYSSFSFKNVMALTINSTAIIEAVSHGCGAIWMPYLNSRSLLFYDVMAKLGIVLDNVDELNKFLQEDKTEKLKFIDQCQKAYIEFFEAEDETEKFLQKMNLV